MKRLSILFPCILLLTSCFNQIDYTLSKKSIKYVIDDKMIILEDNQDFKITYSSFNVIKNYGYYPSELTFFNKSNYPISLKRVLFIQKPDVVKEEIKTEDKDIMIDAKKDSDSFFLPQYGIGQNLIESNHIDINKIYDYCEKIKEINVIVYAEFEINNKKVKINHKFTINKNNSFYY